MVWTMQSSGITDARKEGPSTYTIDKLGMYTVGRKDCSIIINTDKAVSRLHADVIFFEEEISLPNSLLTAKWKVKVKDRSKLGSFISKPNESTAIHVLSLPEKECLLEDGDCITFGTNNTTFKLTFIPLLFCLSSKLSGAARDSALSISKSIGASVVDTWHPECSHLVTTVEESISSHFVEAFAAGRPAVTLNWLIAISERKALDDPFPSPNEYPPVLSITATDGTFLASVALQNSPVASGLFDGFSFLIGPKEWYNEHLVPLIESRGGSVEDIQGVLARRSSQASQGFKQQIWVVPTPNSADTHRQVSISSWRSVIRSLQAISELALLVSLLEGNSKWRTELKAPSIETEEVKSGSTADTAEEDEQVPEVASHPKMGLKKNGCGNQEFNASELENSKDEKQEGALGSAPRNALSSLLGRSRGTPSVSQGPQSQPQASGNVPGGRHWLDRRKESAVLRSNWSISNSAVNPNLNSNQQTVKPKVEEEAEGQKLQTAKVVEGNFEVLFAPLVVRREAMEGAEERRFETNAGGNVPNFKRFQKVSAMASGNTFFSLIPFAKEPYRESDLSKEVEFMRQEKEQRQREDAAEDLFNSDKLKRQKYTIGTGKSAPQRPPRRQR